MTPLEYETLMFCEFLKVAIFLHLIGWSVSLVHVKKFFDDK